MYLCARAFVYMPCGYRAYMFVCCVCVCVRVCLRVCAEANKAAVAAKGGIEAVISAMRRHEGVAGVAEQGCGALWIIAGLGVCSAALFACLRARVWLMAGMHARAGARGGAR